METIKAEAIGRQILREIKVAAGQSPSDPSVTKARNKNWGSGLTSVSRANVLITLWLATCTPYLRKTMLCTAYVCADIVNTKTHDDIDIVQRQAGKRCDIGLKTRTLHLMTQSGIMVCRAPGLNTNCAIK